MKTEQIYSKIETTYNSEKGKGFIVHLLRSFFPVNKSKELFVRLEENEKPIDMLCCITGKKLSSKCEKIEKALEKSEILTKDFMDRISDMVKGNEVTPSTEAKEAMTEIRNMGVAITCESSSKLLSIEAFQQLYNFWCTQILKGDKHLNWVVKNERSKEITSKMAKEGYTKPEQKVVKKAYEQGKQASYSLGELDVLKSLRTKLEQQEK